MAEPKPKRKSESPPFDTLEEEDDQEQEEEEDDDGKEH
jgi:hypothetical protein